MEECFELISPVLYLQKMTKFKKTSTFYRKLPLFIKKLNFAFIKNSIFGINRDPWAQFVCIQAKLNFHTINESHFFLGNAESNRYNEEVFKNSLKFAILGQVRRLMSQQRWKFVWNLFSAEFPTGGFWGGSQGSLLPEEAAVDQGTISNYQKIILVEAWCILLWYYNI